jgi:3-deoxy-D-manno-octulosonic acid kinase
VAGARAPAHAGGTAARVFTAPREVRFLGRDLAAGTVAFAWGDSAAAATSVTRLPGTILVGPHSVTASIDRLEALATRTRPVVPTRPADFTWRPLRALLRRLWSRRRHGVPGLILAIIETYGEVLTTAQTWERHNIAARRAERESGVPPGFHHWRTPHGSLTLRDGTPSILRESLLDATPDVVAGMPLAGGRGAVWAVPLAGPDERGVLRWYRRGGAIRHLIHDRYFGWTPRPIRELALTEEAIRRGVPAPHVLAARVDRMPWGWYRGAIVTLEVAGAATFADELHRLPDGTARADVLRSVGRAVRDMHDRGVHHRDLNAANILVTYTPGAIHVWFIDFDRANVHTTIGRGIRERELRRLERSLVKLAARGMRLGPEDSGILRRAYDHQPEPL